jgi:hypothetical protein
MRVRKAICTCSRPLEKCPVWGPFKDDPSQLDGLTHHDLTLALFRQLPGQDAIMVDSSKTAWGSTAVPFTLVHAISTDFRLIHIVRDPRAVCWSTLKKATATNRIRVSRSLFCSRALMGWWVANLASELFGWMYPDQYVCVRYEDLARSPCEVINRLLPDGDCTFNAIEARENRHQLYGNRMRSRVLSIESVKEDDAWKTKMPAAIRRLAYILSWPLCVKYGYR